MSKKRPEYQPTASAASLKHDKTLPTKKVAKPKRPASGVPWHPVVRGLVSMAVALHLLAVFAAPWDLSTKPALPPGYFPAVDASGRPQLPAADDPAWQQPVVPRALRQFFHHYLNLTYQNQSYQFFAPDPAGSHVIDYQVTQSDGTVVKGRFPDLESQWPRLFYHRHLMLAEQTELMGSDSGLQYANFLARRHGGRCRMELLTHLLLPAAEVKAGKALSDPGTYRVLASVESDSGNWSSIGSEAPITIPGGIQ